MDRDEVVHYLMEAGAYYKRPKDKETGKVGPWLATLTGAGVVRNVIV